MGDLAPKQTNQTPADWEVRALIGEPLWLGGILLLYKANPAAL